MFGTHRQRVPKVISICAGLETSVAFIAFYFGLILSWVDFTASADQVLQFGPRAFLFAGIIFVSLLAVGLYHPRYFAKPSEIAPRLVAAALLVLAGVSLLRFAFPSIEIWRSVAVFAIGGSIVGIAVARLATLQFANTEVLKQRVLVLGTGRRAAKIEERENQPDLIGFVCVAYVEMPGEQAIVRSKNVLRGWNSLARYATEQNVDEIVVAVDERRGALPSQELIECRAHGIVVIGYQEFHEREFGCVDIGAMGPNWFLRLGTFRSTPARRAAKRLMDVAVSIGFVVLFLPLIALTAFAIRLEDGGPAFFRQDRTGLNGRTFSLLKFRSMRVQSEPVEATWAKKDDDRITRVGRIVRRYRLDELPQLFNVLRGEMSFVGPRPEQNQLANRLSQEIQFYSERHWVKPGITGWAQINYHYGASVDDSERKLSYDLYYLAHYGIRLDILIIIQTVRVILWPDSVP